MIKFKFKLSTFNNGKRYKSLLSSNEIRKRFVDYFVKENDHKYIKSSPVVPYNDPSIAFVNAGMCQVRIFQWHTVIQFIFKRRLFSLKVCYLDKEL